MTGNLRSLLSFRLKSEFEIYVLMVVFAGWYFFNSGGALEGDEPVFALQGYYFFKGNMPAEQFRPMGRYFIGLGQLFFGRTIMGAKFFIVFLSILTVYLTYRAAKALSSRVLGFFSALILGIIPHYGDLSVMVLLDIIMTFFGVLLLCVVLLYMRTADTVKQQRLIFFMGALSVCTIAVKLYGVAFSMVVFLFLLHSEWKTLKTIELLKRKNIARKAKKSLVLAPVFTVLGVLFGLLMRAQMSHYWDGAGEKGKSDIINVLPGFLEEIVLDMNGTQAYMFFMIIGAILFMMLWIIVALVGRESLTVLKSLVKKMPMDPKFNILIFLLGAAIGFAIIYSPYLHNPVALLTQALLVQATNLSGSQPKEIAGVVYETAPWWSYLYWIYEYLGVAFVVGLVLSGLFTAYGFIKEDRSSRERKFLFFYIFIPLFLLSLLSMKNPNYFVMLFPLFTIYMVVEVKSLVDLIAQRPSSKYSSVISRFLPVGAVAAIMLLPGPAWMTLDDPGLGRDSGYDEAAELVTDYVDTNADGVIYIIALDRYALEFHLSDEILDNSEIIPLFSDDYSVDALGHPFTYYPESDLYNMTVNGTIDLVVDDPGEIEDSNNIIRNHVHSNATGSIMINHMLAVYYLK